MRLNFTVNNVDISITADNGVYMFDSESGLGKTYLNKCLKIASSYGHQVDGYTYNDLLKGIGLDEYTSGRQLRCLMVDRYDLYNGRYNKLLEELGKTCIVLVDCKGNLSLDYEYCLLELTEKSIEVDMVTL